MEAKTLGSTVRCGACGRRFHLRKQGDPAALKCQFCGGPVIADDGRWELGPPAGVSAPSLSQDITMALGLNEPLAPPLPPPPPDDPRYPPTEQPLALPEADNPYRPPQSVSKQLEKWEELLEETEPPADWIHTSEEGYAGLKKMLALGILCLFPLLLILGLGSRVGILTYLLTPLVLYAAYWLAARQWPDWRKWLAPTLCLAAVCAWGGWVDSHLESERTINDGERVLRHVYFRRFSGNAYAFYRSVDCEDGGWYSFSGGLSASGKWHGKIEYVSMGRPSGYHSETSWYWYGQEVTEGEWHLRNK